MDVTPETRYAKSGDVNIAYQVRATGRSISSSPRDTSRTSSCTGRCRASRAVPARAPVVLPADPLRQARNGHVRPRQRRADARDADGRRAGRHGRRRLARAAFYGLSEGAAMSILFAATYPERTAALVVRGAFPRGCGRRITPGAGPRRSTSARSSADLRLFGPRDEARRVGAGVRRFDDEEAEAFLEYVRLRLEPRRARGAAPDEQGDRHPARASGGARADARPPRRAGHVVPRRGRALRRLADAGRAARRDPGRRPPRLRAGRADRRARSGVPRPSLGGGRLGERRAGSRPGDDPLHRHRRARPRRLPSSATAAGGSCSSGTTRSSGGSSRASAGRELDTAGDGFFARFDGPARAIRCACAIREAVQRARPRGPRGPAHR